MSQDKKSKLTLRRSAKPVDPKDEAAVRKALGKNQYYALKRRIVDPYTNIEFWPNPSRPTEPIEMSSWLQCQIDAGLIGEAPVHGA